MRRIEQLGVRITKPRCESRYGNDCNTIRKQNDLGSESKREETLKAAAPQWIAKFIDLCDDVAVVTLKMAFYGDAQKLSRVCRSYHNAPMVESVRIVRMHCAVLGQTSFTLSSPAIKLATKVPRPPYVTSTTFPSLIWTLAGIVWSEWR